MQPDELYPGIPIMEFENSSDNIIDIVSFNQYTYKGYIIKRLDYLRQSPFATMQAYPVRKWVYGYSGQPIKKPWESLSNELKAQPINELGGQYRLAYYDQKAKEMVIFRDFVPDVDFYLTREEENIMAKQLPYPMHFLREEYNEADWDVD